MTKIKKIRQYFATNIYHTALLSKSSKLNKDMLQESGQIEDFDDEGRSWSLEHYPEGFTSYSSRNDLHYFSSTFLELEKLIRPHVKSFARSLEYDLRGCQVSMTDCWLNIMRKGSVHTSHIHPLSFISGTYYVQVPKGASGLKFEDPRLAFMMAAPPRLQSCKDHNKQFIEVKSSAGDLILFESWLRHEVPPMLIDGERISVSFNYAVTS